MGHFGQDQIAEVAIGFKLALGRHTQNDIQLLDREVSKLHAIIERRGKLFFLRDLNSSNGSFVNGRKVNELQLADGDEIVLGNSWFIFRSGEVSVPTHAGVMVVDADATQSSVVAEIEAKETVLFRPLEQHDDLQTLKQDYEKLRIANEFHRLVGMEPDFDSLLKKILHVAFQLLSADNAVLFLFDSAHKLRPKAVYRKKEGDTEEVVISQTLLERVVKTQQAVLTADAVLDSRFSASDSIVAQGIRSAMAVPLLSKNELKGVLFCDTRERVNAFSEKDLRLLSSIAWQAAVSLENAELMEKISKEAVTRAELSRFLSPAVAEMVIRGEVKELRQGVSTEVTTLFADIRGFTSLAEEETPEKVVAMLNVFFSAMAEIVFRFEGTLDKFIGDCIMAVWGPPSLHKDDARRALSAALEMQDTIAKLNAQREETQLPRLLVGIGVNTGQAIVGYMGSSKRHEFTAVGDAVNVASRLCNLAKGGEILTTSNTLEKACEGFVAEPMAVVQVRGKEKGVDTYRVLGLAEG
ncbi:MAG: FHA domain-containing protein [Cystobacterineae bacterium]|nr:FHA domain-containing protein [Cystobacterineae bacterium]